MLLVKLCEVLGGLVSKTNNLHINCGRRVFPRKSPINYAFIMYVRMERSKYLISYRRAVALLGLIDLLLVHV